MLDGNIKQRPPYVLGAEFVLLLVSGLAMALLLPLLGPAQSPRWRRCWRWSRCWPPTSWCSSYGNLVLPLASGLVMILLLFTLNMAYGFFVEARGMRQITGLFGQYVPPELVDEMARNPEQFNMAPRAEELSVLFSDVRGFTTISESLTPEDLSALHQRVPHHDEPGDPRDGIAARSTSTSATRSWRSGARRWPIREHARNAVLAALDMQKAAKTLNEKFKAKGWPTFKIGIGVNSGVMRVGDMGSKIRKAYTVMGDAVNLASRLEGITKQYGADIIIGEGTRKLISGFVCARSTGCG